MKAKQKKNFFLIKAGLKLVSLVGFTQIIKIIFNIGKIKRMIKNL